MKHSRRNMPPPVEIDPALAGHGINPLLLDGRKDRERLKKEFMDKFEAPLKKKSPGD